MASTRGFNDPARIGDRLVSSTAPSRWAMNVPGNGVTPDYMADPHIILQKWGGNLMTNSVDIQSSLLGLDRPYNRDCLGLNEYKTPRNARPIAVPTNTQLTTEQTRAIMPAWELRDMETIKWDYVHLNPQENVIMPFHSMLNTRILEKDHFVRTYETPLDNMSTIVPTPVSNMQAKYSRK